MNGSNPELNDISRQLRQIGNEELEAKMTTQELENRIETLRLVLSKAHEAMEGIDGAMNMLSRDAFEEIKEGVDQAAMAISWSWAKEQIRFTLIEDNLEAKDDGQKAVHVQGQEEGDRGQDHDTGPHNGTHPIAGVPASC
jgi:hypothetical protein